MGIGVESVGQPIQLFVAEEPWGGECGFQRIEHEPIGPWRSEQRGLPVRQRSFGGFFFLKRFPKTFTMVVIAEGEVDGDLIFANGPQQFRYLGVVALLTAVERTIAVDENARWTLRQRKQLAGDG